MKYLLLPIAVLSMLLPACADGSAGSAGLGHKEGATHHAPVAAAGKECAEPGEGCACAGNQAPVSCSPSASELGAPASEGLCFEGTRRCIAGVFGPCEDVRSFAAPEASVSALVNQATDHPPCEECSRRCFVVRDELSPDDGPLSSTYADGLVFHASGGGITLEQNTPTSMPPPIVGLPIGSLVSLVPVGRTATATHTHEYVASPADVYLLGDMSLSMTEETQWLNDRFTDGTFLDSRTRCANGDQTLIDQGIAGAAQCMIEDVWFGGGLYGDIPFTAYGGDEALVEPLRSSQARAVIPFQQTATMSNGTYVTQTMCHYAFTGDPDLASSQVPALYTLATGEGLYAGFDRYAVPASECAAWGDGGQACFREDTPRIVVMLSDSPMHNGPDPASYPYDYDPSELDILIGTGPGAELVPPTNESWDTAYHVTDNAESELAIVVGDSDLLEPDLPGALVGCGADDGSKDGVFSFDVVTSSGNADVTLSLANTTFPSVLSVFSGPPSMPEALPSAGDGNELFANAHDLGDLTDRSIIIPGDTTSASSVTDMSADYQGALIGAACGANTLAPDAVYAFDVDSASGPLSLELTADMGGSRAVLAVFEDNGVRRWPASASPLTATGNSGASAANVFDIPSGAGNEYVSVRGDTSSLGADFNAADLGGSLCSPDNAAKDAAFHIRVEGTQTLRFDTEGSSFDTVLSLHDRPPLTNRGAMLRFTAAETHQNMNEDAASAHPVGEVNGRSQVFEGSTAGMRADVTDTFGCGTQSSCGDAVYRIEVTQRTALRIDVAGTGYEPGVVVTRADPAGVSGSYLPIATGGRHTCAISAGDVFCWGADDQGQLGNGGAAGAPDSAAAVLADIPGEAQSICAGTQHACASTVDGDVYCWGAGGQGRLGNGSDATQFAPVLVSNIGGGQPLGLAAQVTCGDAFSCVLLRDGRVACFGANGLGQVGDTTTTERRAPVLVSTAERFEQVEAGHAHACAIRTSDNAVFCWGEGTFGKLGDNAVTNNLVPARAGTLVGASYVMAGGQHTCASMSSGRVYCWGRNNVGQLGRGTAGAGNQMIPIVVRNADGSADLANVRGGMAAGDDHTCVTTLEGYVMCWGGNANREIGHNNNAGNVTRPVGVHNLLDAVQVASGQDHTCAVRANSQLACWGLNGDAQLGDGTSTTPAVPVRSQTSGSQPVSFGDGTVDAAFTQACRSAGEAPEDGCELHKLGDENYFFCDGTTNARTWAGAAQACEQVGMQLAVVDEAGENAFIAGRLEGSEQAWLGVKRESDDSWLNLGDEPHFEDINGERVFYTEGSSWLSGVVGVFTDAAAPDLVDSKPRRTNSSTWASGEPDGDDGENCVTIDRAGKWHTEPCSAIPKRDCGFLGLGCLLGFLGDLVGGILDWIVPWVGDITRIVLDSLAGRYASPQFSGGVDHAYVCEEIATSSDITLDPGEYYVTVKGVDDGVTGNACEGPYELTVTDLGSPTGGFIACDDSSIPETNSSVIERTLTTGDYYLILKGKRPTDEGSYNLTVRDVAAVTSNTLACDAGLGTTDPATTTITAQPGHRYYAVVKGDGPGDRGPFNLSIEDTTSFSSTQIACDAGSGPTGNPELSLSLPAGTYYAVIKGQAAWHSGNYQLSIGGAEPDTGTFVPPTYDEAVQALNDHNIRVATVISCDPADSSCADARDQAAILADDTGGVVSVAASAADVPLQIVRVIEQVTAADRIAGSLVFAPDGNPGFSPYTVEAVPDPGNHCTMGVDGQSFVDCTPGATPAFLVSLHNPLLAPVIAATNLLGLYQFTLRVTTEREGEAMRVEDVPLFVQPSGAPEPGSFGRGDYFQEFNASGCAALNAQAEDAGTSLFRPSWDELRFDADVQPDTSLSFYACGAESEAELAGCDDADRMHRVVTVSAGTDTGTRCTVATQATDCPFGYCSPYINVCQYLEGVACDSDDDCPGRVPGRCHSGPSAGSIGRTCLVESLIADPASALGTDNLPYLRMTLALESGGDGARTPSVFWWEARYNCNLSE
jgi:alpha-tubulin suppressor-like RCC1 family protein